MASLAQTLTTEEIKRGDLLLEKLRAVANSRPDTAG